MEIYNKYKIEHWDGTPLKGKQYFVLCLDSDNPEEAARVAKAMRAYQEILRNCDIGTPVEQADRFLNSAEWEAYQNSDCVGRVGVVYAEWMQSPYRANGEGEANAIQ